MIKQISVNSWIKLQYVLPNVQKRDERAILAPQLQFFYRRWKLSCCFLGGNQFHHAWKLAETEPHPQVGSRKTTVLHRPEHQVRTVYIIDGRVYCRHLGARGMMSNSPVYTGYLGHVVGHGLVSFCQRIKIMQLVQQVCQYGNPSFRPLLPKVKDPL